VTFTRAAIDLEMASDPLLPEIGWAWLMESLKKHNCDYIAASGTVTRVASASFGELEDKEEDSEIEIRASWTPTNESQLVNNLHAWLELLGMTAGLEPIPEGVASISRKI
jgi:Cys-tRNA synthase (O-phospho-L-seryl-tRNA:Cys-tRNA synthase)